MGALWDWYLYICYFLQVRFLRDYLVIVFTCMAPRSNDYSENKQAATRSPWKAILLNKVTVGKGFKIKTNNDKLTAPPAGYDSVS
jgi:hypothetical protein